jgi:hypothetical protein
VPRPGHPAAAGGRPPAAGRGKAAPVGRWASSDAAATSGSSAGEGQAWASGALAIAEATRRAVVSSLMIRPMMRPVP